MFQYQEKILTASATIVVTGDKNAYKGAEKIFEGSKMLGIIDEVEFNATVNMITNLFDQNKIKSILDIPENEIPVLMITMGKIDQKSNRIRGYRKSVNEYVKFLD